MLTARRRARRVLNRPKSTSRLHITGTPTVWLVSAAALASGILLRSVVAAVIVAGYALVAVGALRRHRARARQRKACLDALDQLNGYAAIIRAGKPAGALALPDPGLDDMVRAGQRLADRTGAPLADLLDRIEQQRRIGLRTRAAAQAQAAGARATAVLLAALPVGGLALGYLIGADPLDVLLHTPIGAACALAAAMLQVAGLLWSERITASGDKPPDTRPRPPRRRLRRLVVAQPKPKRPWLAASAGLAAAALAMLLIPSWPGIAAAGIAAAGMWLVLPRLPSPLERDRRRRLAADLPLAADLTAAALRAGSPVDGAVLAVAEVMTGPVAQRLAAVGRSLRLGMTAEQAWQQLADVPAGRRLARAAVRSADSGAALAGALTRCAEDLRNDAAVADQATAQRAAVLIVLPLGLCFLPAFVLAGLVPVVLAVLGEIL